MGPGGETVSVRDMLTECTCEERERRYQSFSNLIAVTEEKDSTPCIVFHKVTLFHSFSLLVSYAVRTFVKFHQELNTSLQPRLRENKLK